MLGTVLLVFNPLSVRALSDLLKVANITTTLRYLHSVLIVPDSERTEDPVRIFHKSFPDFLTDPKRCKDKQFLVDPTPLHTNILLLCLDLMRKKLKRNIFNLEDCIDLRLVDDLPTRQKDHIGDALKYACQFWIKHLLEIPCSSSYIDQVEKAINDFFATSLLHWIELLVLTRNIDLGIYAMNDLGQWCTSVSDFLAIY